MIETLFNRTVYLHAGSHLLRGITQMITQYRISSLCSGYLGLFHFTGSTNVPGKSVGVGCISVAGPYKTGITWAYCSEENLYFWEVRISIWEWQHLSVSVIVGWGIKKQCKTTDTFCCMMLGAWSSNSLRPYGGPHPAISLRDSFCVRKIGLRWGGGWIHHRVKMPVFVLAEERLLVGIGRAISVLCGINGLRKKLSHLVVSNSRPLFKFSDATLGFPKTKFINWWEWLRSLISLRLLNYLW